MFLPSNFLSDVIALSIVIQSAIIIILSIEPGIENVIMMVHNNYAGTMVCQLFIIAWSMIEYYSCIDYWSYMHITTPIIANPVPGLHGNRTCPAQSRTGIVEVAKCIRFRPLYKSFA
jgi:hypothetical protein